MPVQVDPNSLIGNADPSIVEPRATAALIDSFRQGVITADDIVNRIGQLGQSKKKAEIDVAGAQSMQAREAMSPEAQAARAQGLATQTAVGATAQAQAERAKILTQYPAVAYFDQLAGAAGITEPKNSDGTPDYKQMEVIGAELALDKAKKVAAAAERANIDARFDADNQVVSAFTKQGAPVDPAQVRALDRTINTPFSRQAPGTMVTPRAAPAVGTAPVVEPSTGAIPFGTPVGGGYAMGGKPKIIEPPKSTAEQDKAALALTRFAESKKIQDDLQRQNYDPTSYGSWISGMLPQVLKSGDRKLFETAVESWGQGLLRLESGAAISPKEKTWYMQTFFPTVSDPAAVVSAKSSLRSAVEREMAEIALKGGVISPEAVRNADAVRNAPTILQPATPTVIPTVKSAAEVATLPATVEFFLTPDGRTKKNPNFRP